METPISIVIPAFNELDYCRQCVDAIRASTRRPYRLILVDNGSTDGVGEYFDSVPDADVVHSPTNRGFAGGVNLGLERAAGHVVLLNSDTLVPAGWLARLEAALLASPDIGMVGPMSNRVSGSQQIDGLSFAGLDEITAYANELAARNPGRRRDARRLVGFCLLLRDKAIAEVGLFDERYGIGNYEDDDYCVRVLMAGYRLCVAEDAFVFHYGSRTFLGMNMTDGKWRALMAKNEHEFEQKWRERAADRSGPADESRRLNEAARAAVEAGDVTRALALLNQAIAVSPLYDRNYNDLGAVLWELRKYERAFDQFRLAVRLNPDAAEARDNLRAAAWALDREAEAAELLGEDDADNCG